MTSNPLLDLIKSHDAGTAKGITSVCSAHPVVLATALQRGARTNRPVLIEATCNQVNQEGGYTGMHPADFQELVKKIATSEGFNLENLILGGDHLGPNPWRHLPFGTAMEYAKSMVAAYAAAGFSKIHLDASMSCLGDPTPLPEPVIAKRAAELAAVAEANGAGQHLSYVIGTEVPVPGGATEHVADLLLTTPKDAAETVALHKSAFEAAGIGGVFGRVVGLVVQPGVEFGHENIHAYAPNAAHSLSQARSGLGLVYEAHSTDYQSAGSLRDLVKDGFAILKVGPWLTYALRETLYGLDSIAGELTGTANLKVGMEELMCAQQDHWASHYHGNPDEQRLQRHFSYSDRIRYYWATPQAKSLVSQTFEKLSQRSIPEPLISQYLGGSLSGVQDDQIEPTAQNLLRLGIAEVLMKYEQACQEH